MTREEKNQRDKSEKGSALRKKDIESHISKISDKMKSLESQGRTLIDEGGADTPEYDALVEQHRMLRGKQRFFQAAIKNELTANRSADEPSDALNIARAEKEETGGQALDRLIKEKRK